MNTDEIPENKKAFLRAFLKVWKMKKGQEQQKPENETTEEVVPKEETQQQPKSQVFSREEYAKDQFWEDRYKEHKGTFDWYVEWPELKYYLEESEMKIKKTDSILMVGCGNSKLSEQMYKDGYRNIVSIDISQTIVDRMQQLADQQQLNLKYLVMDATEMQFKDLEFDVAIDKGTLDALSCGEDIKNLALLKEMSRVAKQNIIISHSSHTKRYNIINQAYDARKILETKIKLSGQSELINIIRTKLKDKPLSHILKDKVALVQCIQEYKATQKLLKDQPKEEILEFTICKQITQPEQIQNEPEQIQQVDQEQVQTTIYEEHQEQQIEETIQNEKEVVYDPRRQSHCFIYKIL